MVLTFLEKYREELTSEKMEVDEDYELIVSRIRENEKFLLMLQEENEDLFTGFSPREYHSKSMEKAEEIQILLSNLYEQKEISEQKRKKIISRLDEIAEVILSVKKQKKEMMYLEEHYKNDNFAVTQESSENTDNHDDDINSENIRNTSTVSSTIVDASSLHQLKNISSYLLSDPYRAKIEIDYLIEQSQK